MRVDSTPRQTVPLTEGWRFLLGDMEGAEAPVFDDGDWRSVHIPHDWSVESSFDEGLEGATAYLPGGIGWYRKKFRPLGTERTYLHFDGIYNHSTVYLNGKKLGDHPYGYSPFYFDITDWIVDGENVVSVRVDRSRYCDSRWYTGSGIYRRAELIGTSETHVPVWGTFVTTPEVSRDRATVRIEVEIAGPLDEVTVETEIVDPTGETVAKVESAALDKVTQIAEVLDPEFWELTTPQLYQAVTRVWMRSELLDTYVTRFGIRTIHFDADKGFFLNGKNTKVKGVCLHHDAGCVGAAVPDDVWRRRLETLKEAGCNAVRIAHNPASSDFLSLCDEIGLLVQDEFFDEWDNPKDKRLNMNDRHSDYISRGYAEHFEEWAERDLKDTIRSHRNHPSIFQWSIGNEIEWTYPRNAEATGFFHVDWSGNYFWDQPPNSPEEIRRLLETLPNGEHGIGRTAQKLSKWTKELDTSRPVIANCILPSSSYLSGYADALDVIGFSYRRVMYDYGHKNYPRLPLMGTENLPQWHEWKAVAERPFVAGTFLWTGIDYLGEVDNRWPVRANESGLLDTAGFPRGSYHMLKTLWSDDPHLHLTTQTLEWSPYSYDEKTGFIGEDDPTAWERKLWAWQEVNTHWNYTDGEMIAVEVYSNSDDVELFLNGQSLGSKKLSDFPDRIFKWAVPFEAGKLEARAAAASDAIETSGSPVGIELMRDGVHVIAQLVDEEGRPVKSEEREVRFSVSGVARILGVDNGSICSTQDFQSDRLTTSQGRCLLVLSDSSSGEVFAHSPEIESAQIELEAYAALS
ncbi:MAG: glycoside hydrolase family 2 TIM barrel-domain containing protein [Verrucomicrobiota bacterium]